MANTNQIAFSPTIPKICVPIGQRPHLDTTHVYNPLPWLDSVKHFLTVSGTTLTKDDPGYMWVSMMVILYKDVPIT